MGETIKVNVFNRQFPVSASGQEVVRVRELVKQMDAKAKEFRKKFAVKDDLDLAVMCAIHFGTQNTIVQDNGDISETKEEKLSQIESLLDKALKKYSR